MTISRCSELLAILVKKPLRMIGRSKARLDHIEFGYIKEAKIEFQSGLRRRMCHGWANTCSNDTGVNVEAMTKGVDFFIDKPGKPWLYSVSVNLLSLWLFLPFFNQGFTGKDLAAGL